MHTLAVALMIAAPTVRERILDIPAVQVSLVEAVRERPPETRPLPALAMKAVPQVAVSPPLVPIVAEVQVTPPPEVRPTLTVPPPPQPATAIPELPPASPSESTDPPRFEMAYLRNPAPAYPSGSRRAREQGRVIVAVTVSASGEAQSAEVRTSSGFPRLDQAALEAVKRWRFEPARRGKGPVAGVALVPILFELET